MTHNYVEANEVLRRGAKGMLRVSIVVPLVLLSLGIFRALTTHGSARGLASGVTFAVIGLVMWYVSRSRYRDLSAITVSEDGITISRNGRQDMIPWSEIEKIRTTSQGFRVFPRNRPSFAGNLTFAGDTRPLIELLKDKATSALARTS